jgi:hypothetical protein
VVVLILSLGFENRIGLCLLEYRWKCGKGLGRFLGGRSALHVFFVITVSTDISWRHSFVVYFTSCPLSVPIVQGCSLVTPSESNRLFYA